MKERTISIQGKDVTLVYCAATENGFEELSGKSIYDINFKSQHELLILSISAIVAAYSRKGEEPPITSDTLLYYSKPDELAGLVKATLELRAEWYGIPKVLSDALDKEKQDTESEEVEKN